MSNSLPKLPARTIAVGSSQSNTRVNVSNVNNRQEAWGSIDKEKEVTSLPVMNSLSQLPVDVPGESSLTVGLTRIVDSLSRKMLPWQAILCPRAVETLRDLRLNIIQSKHNVFIHEMRQKLEDKVMGFIRKKDEEVDIWMEKEIKNWQLVLSKDEVDLTDFIKSDLNRIANRLSIQDIAYRQRETDLATLVDDNERDATREQLMGFRRMV